MTMKPQGALRSLGLTAAVASCASLVGGTSVAQADSISSVENARAKERAGYYVSRQDREKLRRYGRNDDGYYGGYRDYYGPSNGVSVHIGPRSYDGGYYDD